MILSQPKVQKRNLALSGLFVLFVILWIVIRDPSFSEINSLVLVGLATGYTGFAIFDYRDAMNQIFRPGHPNRRNPKR